MVDLILKPPHFGCIRGKTGVLVGKRSNLALQFVELCRVKCRC
ncbi:hypothetical protein [Phyllobacterium sp.]